MAEIRDELLKSKRLDAYFEKNPRERLVFEQDRKQYKLKIHSPAIADVPDYLGLEKFWLLFFLLNVMIRKLCLISHKTFF